MEMLDLKQVILTRNCTSSVTRYLLEITTTDSANGTPKHFQYTDLHHPDLSSFYLWIQNQVHTLEQDHAKRVILTIGDEITLKVEK